jgi:Cu-Zn family superoxide dismutase
MGNWDVDSTGNVFQNKTLDLLSLHGANSIIGRAVVIHNDTDNCISVSSSGARLAFCVIGIANRAENNASVGATVVNATCIMKPTNTSTAGQMPVGQVWFIQGTYSVEVRAQITGMTGTHGFHVHQYGTVATDGLASGVHWNYGTYTHGIPQSGLSRHNGDMGNIYYYSAGTAYYSFDNDMLNLNGIESIVGRIVHVHQNPDICTPPIGLAGNRIGQCVIGIANPTTTPIALPVGVPTIQAVHTCFNSTTAPVQSATIPADNTNVAVNAIPSIVFAVVLLAVALF